jgi:hypothetical protein
MSHYLQVVEAAAELSAYPGAEFGELLKFMADAGRVSTCA